MKSFLAAIFAMLFAIPALAIDLPGRLDNAVVKKVNAKLLTEGRKINAPSRPTATFWPAVVTPKIKRLGAAVLKAKKMLTATGLSGFHFVVTGHTDSAIFEKK